MPNSCNGKTQVLEGMTCQDLWLAKLKWSTVRGVGIGLMGIVGIFQNRLRVFVLKLKFATTTELRCVTPEPLQQYMHTLSLIH